jgi:heme-degrading monooxygenase HmoA
MMRLSAGQRREERSVYARHTTITADPGKLEETIERVRQEVLPALQSADGFRGFTLLVDRKSGTLAGTSFFESRETLEASEQAVRGPREQAASVAGAGDLQVHVMEVAIDVQV